MTNLAKYLDSKDILNLMLSGKLVYKAMEPYLEDIQAVIVPKLGH